MRKKVLLIDDNEKNRKLLRVLLSKSGYQTLEAENGLEGVRSAHDNSPDLIIMDVRMPVMDGISATKLIKNDPATSNIPVIITTSSAMRGDKDRIMSDSGCDMYISKPISVAGFLDILEKYIGEKDGKQ